MQLLSKPLSSSKGIIACQGSTHIVCVVMLFAVTFPSAEHAQQMLHLFCSSGSCKVAGAIDFCA